MSYLYYKSVHHHHLVEQPTHPVLMDNLHASSRDHTAEKNKYTFIFTKWHKDDVLIVATVVAIIIAYE